MHAKVPVLLTWQPTTPPAVDMTLEVEESHGHGK